MTVKQTGRSEGEVLRAAYFRPRFDVILLQEPPVTHAILNAAAGAPVILLERVDGAQLRAARDYLPRVAGLIKSYAFRNRADYNTVNDRAHIAMLHEAGISCRRPLYRPERPRPQLCADHLAKIRIGYSGFGCHEILRPCVEQPVDLDARRPIDVHFAGTVDYEGSEVDTHRRYAFKAVMDWPGPSIARAGRGIPRKGYYAQIRQSKTVLCPWGWGEASYREHEAWALGAVVIKPDTAHVEAWPDVYDAPAELYVRCKPDLSDVHDKLSDIAEHWDEYRAMRALARLVVVDAWQPEAIAKRMSSLIKELVQ